MYKEIIQKAGKYFTETEKHQIIQELISSNAQISEIERNLQQWHLDNYSVLCVVLNIPTNPWGAAACLAAYNAKQQRDAWENARVAYQNGVNYLNNFNDTYKTLIGAQEWVLWH